MLQSVFADPSNASYIFVKRVACEHQIGYKKVKKTLLIKKLQEHTCNWGCLIHTADAQNAGTVSSLSIISDALHNEHQSHGNDHLPPIAEKYSHRTQRRRKAAEQQEQMEADDCIDRATSWPQVQSDETVKQVCF